MKHVKCDDCITEARADALEDAAKVCDRRADKYINNGREISGREARRCAAEIRAMKGV